MIDPVRLSRLRAALRLIARRGPLVAGVVVFGAAVAVATMLSEPLRWRSVETLAVLEPRVDPRLATSGLPPISERLIEAARLDLLSHEKASEVISAYGLYPGNLSLDQKVEELRGDVSFETALDSDGRPTSVTISAVMDAPEVAQSVTQELAHRLIASVVRDRIAAASETLAALSREERRLAARLEADIAAEVPEESGVALLRERWETVADQVHAAELAYQLELNRRSESLRTTDPAVRAEQPEMRTRGPIAAVIGAVTSVLAVIVAFLAEGRRPVLRDAARMKRLTGIAPIVTIPFDGRYAADAPALVRPDDTPPNLRQLF